MSAFLDLFRLHADSGPGGVVRMPFDRFMKLALYDPALGYYSREHGPMGRVGRGEGTDFFTSSTSGPVFGELICAAAEKLLRERGEEPGDYIFVEIGAEPGGGVLKSVTHPFAGERTIRLGTVIAGNTDLREKRVVFSNELFDAQPFRRFVFRRGVWRELGVALDSEGAERGGVLVECEMSRDETDAGEWASVLALLPPTIAEGWHVDLPLDSAVLAREIAAQPWSGLFLACDYGKSWRELVETTAAGTGRAYHRHRQSNDLLANPGEQDLTCHVCWDWITAALCENGFGAPGLQVESQEAFFMRHAAAYLAKAFADDAGQIAAAGSRKRALMQLLHPAHMGQKFQVLHSFRR